MQVTVYDKLLATSREQSGAVGLRFGKSEFRYGELLAAVDVAAARLLEFGIGPGDVFSVFCENRPDLLLAYFAGAKIGAVIVPVNPSLTAPEVAQVVAHSGAKILFHDEAMGAVAQVAVSESIRRPIAGLSQPCAADRLVAPPYGAARPDQDFLVVYTSGSTGRPKAVVFDHAAEIAGNASLIEMWRISRADVMLVALPLGYLYGLSTAAATGLQAGAQVVLLRRFHPGEVLSAMLETRASVFHGVPTMYSMMLEYAEQNGLRFDLSFVRLLICAGAPLSNEMRQRFRQAFGKDIQDYYALTEARPVFGTYAGDQMPLPAGAIGRAAPGVTARILDGRQQECANGCLGELVVRSPATLKRYHRDPELTANAMQDGFFRTGDIGYCDANGYYFLTGRIKDIIIRGGEKIAPAEVEMILAGHGAVQEVAVVGVADSKYGEVPVAFVVKRRESQVLAEELATFARASLADFKVPRSYIFRSALPLGITGKVDKAALRAAWREQTG
jgi:long-chain acyl-CoA synthetase